MCISIAKPNRIKKDIYSSVTLGFLIDSDLEKKIKFLNDPKIQTKETNDTCEKCVLSNCKERVAEPTVVQNQFEKEKIKLAIDKLLSD